MARSGEARNKEWDEFQRSFRSALILTCVLDDLDKLAPSYLDHAASTLRDLRDLKEVDDAPIDPEYSELAEWIEEIRDHPNAPAMVARSLAAVALHSAVEAYAKAAFNVARIQGPLPDFINQRLTQAGRSALDTETHRLLVDLDATRHITVHNRGVVDTDYLTRVPNSPLNAGEWRLLPFPDLLRFAGAASATAHAIHDAPPRSG